MGSSAEQIVFSALDFIVLALYAAVTLVLLIIHWRRGGTVALRLLWSPILLVPIFGWLFYFSLYSASEPHPRADQVGNDPGFLLQPSDANYADSTVGAKRDGLDAG